VPTEPGVRVAASPWASSWDRRQPLGRGILVTASRSALRVLASRCRVTGLNLPLKRRSHSETLATAASLALHSLRASLRAMWYSRGPCPRKPHTELLPPTPESPLPSMKIENSRFPNGPP
jgi:hypothetical protein